LTQYDFCAEPEPYLAWMGRITPEKGLEDAFLAANKVNMPLKVMGYMQDLAYWKKVSQAFPQTRVDYLGFLSTADMQKVLRKAKVLLVTPKWVEAFGNVAIEALACGVPVIAYRNGGLAEIVKHGKTGYLVDTCDAEGLAQAIHQVDHIKRKD